MKGLFLPLFGAAAGVISVALSLVRRALLSDFPQRRFRVKGSVERNARRGRILPFLIDLLFSFLVGCYLVLYDATVLGGTGRLHHLGAFLPDFLLRGICSFRFSECRRKTSFASFSICFVSSGLVCFSPFGNVFL